MESYHLKNEQDFNSFNKFAEIYPYFENTPSAAQTIYNEVYALVLHSQILPTRGEYPVLNVGQMLMKWVRNKGRFLWLPQFANSLFYKHESDAATQAKLETTYEKLVGYVADIRTRIGLSREVEDDLRTLLFQNKWTLTENRVTSLDDIKLKYKKLTDGMKITRAIGVIAANHPEACRALQDKCSEYIQSVKMSGDFIVSIHPLDYLTSSTTGYDWRSCHALDGDYRCGTLSYMTDASTVVCYLADDEKQDIPTVPFKWYSKRWRRLLHFSTSGGSAVAGRPYPMDILQDYSLNVGREIASGLCYEGRNLPLARDCDIFQWKPFRTNIIKNEVTGENICLNSPIYYFGRDASHRKNHFLVADGALNYDDIDASSQYSPVYCEFYIPSSMRGYSLGNRQRYAIGESVPCPVCGKSMLDEENCMACEDCRDHVKTVEDWCDDCGDPLSGDDTHYHASSVMCSDCFFTEYHYCEKCGNSMLISDGDICEDCFDEWEDDD